MNELVGMAGVPFIIALVEGTKKVWPELPARWYPIVALVWALILNLGAAAYLGLSYPEQATVAFAAALAACGLYSGTKAVAGQS